MQSDIVSPSKVATLRSFAGAGIPDARLRAALIRAGGDLNTAATSLLSDGALKGANSPILVAAQSQSNPPPVQAPQSAAAKKQPASSVRKLAWRQFYRDSYATAVRTVGSEKPAIDSFISELWKAVGSAKREEYTDAIRAQMAEGGDGAVPASTTARAGTVATAEVKAAVDAKAEKDTGAEAEVETKRTRSPEEDHPPPVAGDLHENNSTQNEKFLRSPAKRVRRDEPETRIAEVAAGSPQACLPSDGLGWPRKIASRLCEGTMLTSGKKLLAVNDEVTLEVANPQRGNSVLRGKGKRGGAASSAAKIVRFVKKGRELGRLSVDLSLALAPALQSGFVETSCKVISAPRVTRMFSEVFFDVSFFLKKEAFEGQAEQDAAECGVSALEVGRKEERLAGEHGVDAKRVNVVTMILALNICEPPEKAAIDFPMSKSTTEGAAGALTEEDAEAYYNTVHAIDKKAANSFDPPKHLACTLREYQRAGVGWMVSREQYGSRGQRTDDAAVDCMLDPLWKRRIFPDGGVFFINPTTGGLALDAPIANAGGPFGGILADEMGLGKTVQCIACIVHDMEKAAVSKKSALPRKAAKASRLESPASVAETGASNVNAENSEITKEVQSSTDPTSADEITPVFTKQNAGSASAVVQKSRTDDTNNRELTSAPRRSRRIVARRKPRYSDDDIHDHRNDDSDLDKEWNEGQEPRAVTDRNSQQANGSDDDTDIFVSPRKTAKKSKEPRRKNGSALEKLMAAANSNNEVAGGTLIVCPMSLVTQWLNELHLHVTPNFLRAVAHYGQSRGDALSISLRSADVVVTTYGILASECPSDEGAADRDSEDRGAGGPIFQLDWRRVILDEAHMIKSRTTKWARAAFRIKAEKRWCVTGTVIHNHVNDVFSLLHFLKVKPWASWAFWNRGIVANIESSDTSSQKTAMSLLRDIISSLTLRRKKSTKDTEGRCIVQLPKKTVEIVLLTPSLEEKDFYDAIHERSKVQFDTFVKQGKVMNNYASVLELLLRLRQACDHPYLVFAAAPSKDSVVMKDKDKLYKQFLEAGSSLQFVGKILEDAQSGTLSESSTCPVCLDAIDDAVAPKECGHPACRSCLQESLIRSKKCPVCRVGISSDSVTTLPRATRFSVDLKKKWRSSAKLDALLKDVRGVESQRKSGGGARVGKTVIFSQFTGMLDLVGMALEREKFKSLRIDGSVPQIQRAEILAGFERDDELSKDTANILLVSLRAGGVGLNLVAASRAILLDIHWNPQVDAQAQDRVHRHGQTRDVVIKRYIVKDSVEERLLQVQDRKQDIADGALGVATDEDKKHARISELKLLFSGA